MESKRSDRKTVKDEELVNEKKLRDKRTQRWRNNDKRWWNNYNTKDTL